MQRFFHSGAPDDRNGVIRGMRASAECAAFVGVFGFNLVVTIQLFFFFFFPGKSITTATYSTYLRMGAVHVLYA